MMIRSQDLIWQDFIRADETRKYEWIRDLGRQSQADSDIIKTRIDSPGDHFLVRQGQRSSVVLTSFHPNENVDLNNVNARRLLLSISFNTLSDWHIVVKPKSLQVFFNRKSGDTLIKAEVDHSSLPPNLLGKILGVSHEYAVPANFHNVVDSILKRLEFLKKQLVGDPENSRISDPSVIDHLLNAVIFLRYIEDHRKAKTGSALNIMHHIGSKAAERFDEIVKYLFQRLDIDDFQGIFDLEKLASIPRDLNEFIISSFRQFYCDDRQGQYEYDFGLIAEYALGQIYDKYVALVTDPRHNGIRSFFPEFDTSLDWKKGTGAIYTPDYVSRFMVREALQNFPIVRWKELKVGDLACGSGIFLKNFLVQLQVQRESTGGITSSVLSNLEAADLNRSAIAASRLNIALTVHKRTGALKGGFRPMIADSLSDEYIECNRPETLDLILMNPPFIGYEQQTQAQKLRVGSILEGVSGGRVDYSMAFLKMAISRLKERGCLGIILPASFLDGDYARKMRRFLADHGELKDVLKFEDYTIFERGETQISVIIWVKNTGRHSSGSVKVLYCRNSPDLAIRAVETDERQTKPDWEYFIVDSRKWTDSWPLLPHEVMHAIEQLRRLHPEVSELFEIKQGMKIGHRKVFVIDDRRQFPRSEQEILVPVADNSNVAQWQLFDDQRRLIFAYKDSIALNKSEMGSKYTNILRYLEGYESKLKTRATMGERDIWQLIRPRDPKHMFGPKIISKSFGLTGSYALDLKGKYAVVDCNYLVPKEVFPNEEVWHFYIALLNSNIYFSLVARMSRKLKGGQYDLANRYIKNIPIPRYETTNQDLRQILIKYAKEAQAGELIPNEIEEFNAAILRAYSLGHPRFVMDIL